MNVNEHEGSRITRVLVMGCPGSGKSSFARKLWQNARLPIYHLDDLYWGAAWARPVDAEWRRIQESLASNDRWIIDGNYQAESSARLKRAQLIFILYAPTWLCIFRVINRALKIVMGKYHFLPEQVRIVALEGRKVRPTADLGALLMKVRNFNREGLKDLAARICRDAPAAKVIFVLHGLRRDNTWLGAELAALSPGAQIFLSNDDALAATEDAFRART